MNVYLYELDTVNTSEADMKKAEHAMFREIVVNGNTIVLSGNQLVDSRAFWHVVFDDEKYDVLKRFCRIGRIKVSLKSEDGTPIGFLINRVRDRIRYLEKNSKSGFFFSLFTEIQDRKCFLRDLEEAATKNDIRSLRKKYYDVKVSRYLEILTELSIEGHYLDNEKSDELYKVVSDTYNKLKIEANLSQDDLKRVDVFVKDCYDARVNSRSEIKQRLNDSGFKDKEQVSLFLDTIVNISYNIVVEKSIPNISLRITNLGDVYKNYKTENSEVQDISKDYWEKGVSIVERCINSQKSKKIKESKKSKKSKNTKELVESNDYNEVISDQRKNWIELIKKSMRNKIGTIFVFLVLNVLFFILVCGVQDILNVNIDNILYHYIIAFLIELLISLIMEMRGLQDASDNIVSLSEIREEHKILMKSIEMEKENEKKKKKSMLNHKTIEWNNYIKYKDKHPQLFENVGGEYIFDEQAVDDYCSKNNKTVGIIYKSDFHRLVVDLIKYTNHDGSTEYRTYERLIPVNNGAVVVVPMYEGKYVFLEQVRQTIGKTILTLPRGFGEENIDSQKNVLKELLEEVNGNVIGEPVLLGQIAPDSGVLSAIVDVYFCNLSGVSLNVGYEGIKNIRLLTEGELNELLDKKEIIDGFTLAALMLYKNSIIN